LQSVQSEFSLVWFISLALCGVWRVNVECMFCCWSPRVNVVRLQSKNSGEPWLGASQQDESRDSPWSTGCCRQYCYCHKYSETLPVR